MSEEIEFGGVTIKDGCETRLCVSCKYGCTLSKEENDGKAITWCSNDLFILNGFENYPDVIKCEQYER